MCRTSLLGSLVLASAVVALALGPAGAEARTRQKRQDQRVTGAGVRLDDFNQELNVLFKGPPGKASGHVFVRGGELMPGTERCEGFPFEAEILGGSVVEIFQDFSKLIGEFDTGYVCVQVSGFVHARVEGHWAGGVQRFAAASGPFSLEVEGVTIDSIGNPKGMSASGTITGTILIGP